MGNTESTLSARRRILHLLNPDAPPPSDSVWWDSFFLGPQSAENIFNLFSARDIRTLRDTRPKVFIALLSNCADRILAFRDAVVVNTPSSSLTQSSNNSKYPELVSTSPTSIRILLNAIRFLQRLLPFVFETTALPNKAIFDDLSIEDYIFWTPSYTPNYSVRDLVTAIKNPMQNLQQNVQTPSNTEPNQDETADYNTSQVENQSSNPTLLNEDTERASSAKDPNSKSNLTYNSSFEKIDSSTLGAKLITCLVALLFCRGFTLPETTVITEEQQQQQSQGLGNARIQYLLWYKGIGSPVSQGCTNEILQNRLELLILLQVLISKSMYVPQNIVTKPGINKFAEFLCSGLPTSVTLSLMCSIINAFSEHEVGWSNILPYNYLLVNDMIEQLIMVGLQILIVLIDVGPPNNVNNKVTPISTSSSPTSTVSPSFTPNPDSLLRGKGTESTPVTSKSIEKNTSGYVFRNNFKYYLSKLYREQDFKLISQGVTRTLDNFLKCNNAMLPGSGKRMRYHLETILFWWKLYLLNEKFAQKCLTDTETFFSVLATVIHIINISKDDPSQILLTRLGIFILHTMSQNRRFGVILNTNFNLTKASAFGANELRNCAPSFANTAISGDTWADFLYLSIYNFLTSSINNQKMINIFLQENLVIVIANTSPFVMRLGLTTTQKLLSLFRAISNVNFVLANEHNHKLMFYLLESFNNLLQYQISGCKNLVYAVVRNVEIFTKLQDLTFEQAMAIREKIRTKLALDGSNNHMTTTLNTENHDSKGKRIGNVDDSNQNNEEDSNQGNLVNSNVNSVSNLVDSKDFEPTEEWFNFWKSHLPLAVIINLSNALKTTLEKMCLEKSITDDSAVLDYLEKETLVGLLPLPHPIYIRQFHNNEAVRTWFVGYFWSCIYLKSTAIARGNPNEGGLAGVNGVVQGILYQQHVPGSILVTGVGNVSGTVKEISPAVWSGTNIVLFKVKVKTLG